LHIRMPETLLHKLQREAKSTQQTVQQLVRSILASRLNRKTSYARDAFIDFFAGPPRKRITSFEDKFAGPKGSANWHRKQ